MFGCDPPPRMCIQLSTHFYHLDQLDKWSQVFSENVGYLNTDLVHLGTYKPQVVVASMPMEAEYIAILYACKNSMYIVLIERGFADSQTHHYLHRQPRRLLVTSHPLTNKLPKHIHRHRTIKDCITKCIFKMEYAITCVNIANVTITATDKVNFIQFTKLPLAKGVYYTLHFGCARLSIAHPLLFQRSTRQKLLLVFTTLHVLSVLMYMRPIELDHIQGGRAVGFLVVEEFPLWSSPHCESLRHMSQL